jgi:hypothetical protein
MGTGLYGALVNIGIRGMFDAAIVSILMLGGSWSETVHRSRIQLSHGIPRAARILNRRPK